MPSATTDGPAASCGSDSPHSPTLSCLTAPIRSRLPRCADCHRAREYTWAPTASSAFWEISTATRGGGEAMIRMGHSLAGQPPLDSGGVIKLVEFNARRPFHPQRLHACLDLLLEGVIRTRGRLWLASQPDQAMWLESAGAGLRVSSAGKWVAALTAAELAGIDAERRVFAELGWDDQHGDRHTAMTILTCGADPAGAGAPAQGAVLTDDEFHHPQDWIHYDDPFGDWHEEPCDAPAATREDTVAQDVQDPNRR